MGFYTRVEIRNRALRYIFILIVIFPALFSSGCLAQGSQLALTPPMGWNSWNAFEAKIDEQKIKQIADVMVSSGMRDAGYTYLVLDDGWMAKDRDSAGNLQADSEKYSITKSGTTHLGDIWYIMKSGDAPVSGRSHQGGPLKIAGTEFPVGFGCRTESRIMYKLNGKGIRFQAWVGIDDAYEGTEKARFRVLNEDAFGNRVVFDSGKIEKGTPAIRVDVDITGLDFILLEFQGKEVAGDWIDPLVIAK